jgi:hypothetical protein
MTIFAGRDLCQYVGLLSGRCGSIAQYRGTQFGFSESVQPCLVSARPIRGVHGRLFF